ncbi:hypothetical protein JCM8097_003141 [Rhodosporidiobolus ruineniae]
MPSVSSLIVTVLAAPLLVAAQSANEQAREKGIEVKAGPAAIFFVLYLLATLVQWFHYYRHPYRPRAYMLNLTIGMTCMCIGFLLRIKNNYAWQFLFTFLSPCAFLAADYTILKHLARALGPQISSTCLFLPPRAIVWVFLLSDLVTFCAQTAGTVMTIIGGEMLSVGQKIAIAGLVLQLLSFSLYTVLLFVFARRMSRNYPDSYHPPGAGGTLFKIRSKEPVNDVRLLVRVLGATCIGILIRSVFRLVEQADGFFGFIATHEAFFYLFDATPLWLSMVLFAFVWPTRYIAGAEEATKEAEVGGAWRGEGAELGGGGYRRK